MQRIVREIYAGPCYRAVYSSMIRPKSSGRAGRSDQTPYFQQYLNDKLACEKLEHLLEANFTLDDLYVTTTYADEYLPPNYDAAAKRLRYFFSKYRQARKARGLPHDYVYVIEGEHGDKRMHHHMVVPADGDNAALLKSLWKYGRLHIESIREFSLRPLRKSERAEAIQKCSNRAPNINEPLDLSEYIRKYGEEKGAGMYEIDCFRKVALYMTKEPRKTGRVRWQARMYTPSKGLEKPIVIERELTDSDRYKLPDNVVQLSAERKDNRYGDFGYTLGWAKKRTSLNNFDLKQSINNGERGT